MQMDKENSKNSVLIVDDEVFNLELLEYALESQTNMVTLRAQSVDEALDLLELHEIDLIISDISMPGKDGLEMLQILKSNPKYQYIPVIMVTAKHEERHKALEHGSEDFLLKPIDSIELRFKVTNLLKLKKFNDLQQFFNQKLEVEVAKKEEQLKQFAHMEQELKIAKRIQDSILPTTFVSGANLDVYGKCIQASDVGGDFFDMFETEDGEFTNYIMADVSGHGFSSALVAMQFRSILRCELRDTKRSFAKMVANINTIFSQENSNDSMFVTALFLRFNHKKRVLESVNAGHYNPIGTVSMTHNSGMPFGIFPHIDYEVLTTKPPKGSTILLFTDGILEALKHDGEFYEKNFYESYGVAKGLPAKEQVEYLLKVFQNSVEKPLDDVTLLAIRV
jgi:sigma-B regulation protein RsbU (phosphoserine phosphatase)